jgi:hypothetical protein
MLGLWIVTQFINGVGSIAVTDETGGGGVAYMAHIGWFVLRRGGFGHGRHGRGGGGDGHGRFGPDSGGPVRPGRV